MKSKSCYWTDNNDDHFIYSLSGFIQRCRINLAQKYERKEEKCSSEIHKYKRLDYVFLRFLFLSSNQ